MYKRKDREKKSVKYGLLILVCALGMSVLLSGCDFQMPDFVEKAAEKIGIGPGSQVFRVNKEKCGAKETRIILLNYQKQYGEAYGFDLWDHDYGEEESLEEYVKTLTLSQLVQVYTLDVLADGMDMELSDEEQELAKKAGREFYDGLSKEEKDYLGASADDAEALYERYALAQKLYDRLTESVDQEVSDDEARVMRVKQIFTTDQDKAQTLLQQISEDEDFATLAVANTEAPAVDVNIDRSMFSEDAAEEIFDLEDGETSGIIQKDDGYYIFYCVQAYDADLTEANKADVLERRITDSMEEFYASGSEEVESSLQEEEWEKIEVDTSLKPKGDSFLEIYGKYFGEKEEEQEE